MIRDAAAARWCQHQESGHKCKSPSHAMPCSDAFLHRSRDISIEFFDSGSNLWLRCNSDVKGDWRWWHRPSPQVGRVPAQVLRPDGAKRLLQILFAEYLLVRQHNRSSGGRGSGGGRGGRRGGAGRGRNGSKLSGRGFGRGANRWGRPAGGDTAPQRAVRPLQSMCPTPEFLRPGRR